MADDDDSKQAWDRLMTAVLAVPGVNIDREEFLRDQLARRYGDEQVKAAIVDGPASAGIPLSDIDEIANGCIRRHTWTASGVSAAAGLPGGWTAAITIPADLAQFYWHVLVLQQKLVYLYGWPDLLHNGEVDDETKARLTLFTGVMFGVAEANVLIAQVAERIAKEVGKRVPRMLLTKTVWYPIIKNVAKWVGIRVTKTSFAKFVAKIVPVVGAGISGSLTKLAMSRMARKFKKHLRQLPPATGDRGATRR